MADGDFPPQNPFGGLPFFNDMMRAMSQQGPLNWDLAQQFAQLGAVGDTADPEPDASVRITYNSLADIADLHVQEITSLSTGPKDCHTEILTTTRARWAHRTLGDLRPMFTDLATALSTRNNEGDPPEDPMAAMLTNLSTMMAPAMMGMSIGSMIGALAQHALGQYELPLSRPHSSEILIVSSSVDSFANEWSIPLDDLRMWVLIHELSSHAVLATPAIQDGFMPFIQRHVSAFRPDPQALMESIGELDPTDTDAMSRIQSLFSDPMVLMGAMRTPEQEAMAPVLNAYVAAITGYIDFIVDMVSARLLGSASPIAEAVRRRRVEYGADAQLIERLLGISTSRAQQSRGRSFIDGVVERADAQALQALLTNPENLPTPNEIEAPGLWLARLEVS
ncbi:MAG: zinc-dependent metalloprotease [Ilumatobacteraceae bacterium]